MSQEGDRPNPFAGLEREVGVPVGFIVRLVHEPNHWSMVIKLHALIEAFLGRVLARELRRPAMEQFVDRLPMGRAKGQGRIALAVSLGLLIKSEVATLEALSDLRNRYVHDPTNAARTIAELHASSPRDRQASLEKAFPALHPRRAAVNDDDEWMGRVFMGGVEVLAALSIARDDQLRKLT